MQKQSLQFSSANRDFYITLKKRVDEYFKSNNLSRNANAKMVVKTIALFTLYILPYVLVITHIVSTWYSGIVVSIAMGLGMAGLGFSVMHDAVHESYSKNKTVNKVLGYTMNFLGGSMFNWRIQHNVLHHTFTNVDGHDEDIAPPHILRFSPHAERKPIHKLQFIYAWLLYGIMTIMWVSSKDFKQLWRYKKQNMIREDVSLTKEFAILIFGKLLYYLVMLVIPIMYTSYAWWQIVVGFCILHFTCGLVLSTVFQLAHVIEDTSFPLPDDSHKLENSWAIHQLYTTANFSPNNLLLNWFAGGLNYQVEHHLFPNICHVHYSKIAYIVKDTATEFNLPYYSYNNMFDALRSHTKMLYLLGRT